MNRDLLEILRCPQSGKRLEIVDARPQQDRIESGWLVTTDGKHRYPIRNYVPRFVTETNYADNFGMQWNKFSKTQLDSHSGHPISADRFWTATGWSPADIDGQWVLDVGCGAGRFAEVALNTGARVVALDYSTAVDACYSNLKTYSQLHVVQGDIYALPFMAGAFPFVYSLGVLQHTPHVERAFFALPRMVSPRGALCVDFYEKSWKNSLRPKYLLRPMTKRLPKERLFSILKYLVPKLLPISTLVGKLPLAGKGLRKLLPVANYVGELPLDEKQQLEWSLLDTFDELAPEFDDPQTRATVLRWLHEAGMENIAVFKAGHLVGRGTKSAAV